MPSVSPTSAGSTQPKPIPASGRCASRAFSVGSGSAAAGTVAGRVLDTIVNGY